MAGASTAAPALVVLVPTAVPVSVAVPTAVPVVPAPPPTPVAPAPPPAPAPPVVPTPLVPPDPPVFPTPLVPPDPPVGPNSSLPEPTLSPVPFIPPASFPVALAEFCDVFNEESSLFKLLSFDSHSFDLPDSSDEDELSVALFCIFFTISLILSILSFASKTSSLISLAKSFADSDFFFSSSSS